MPTLVRDDGSQFVYHSYREVLPLTNRQSLTKELRDLSESYGEFVQLLPYEQHVEAIFSEESGYLLGESIRHFLKKKQNFIFCEKISGTEKILWVVARDGKIYEDTVITFEQISDHIEKILLMNVRFDVFVFGNDIMEYLEILRQCRNKMLKFTRLKKPIFPNLPLRSQYRLMTLEQTIVTLNRRKIKIPKSLVFVLILSALVYFTWTGIESMRVTNANRVVTLNSELGELLIASPPDEQIYLLATKINNALAMPGWQLIKVDYHHNNADFLVGSYGGSVEILRAWAQYQKIDMKVENDGINLLVPIYVPKRPLTQGIVELERALKDFTRRMQDVLPRDGVKVTNIQDKKQYQYADIHLQIKELSVTKLAQLGRQMAGLPIKLHYCQMTVDRGLLSGEIKLEMIGK